MKRLIMCEGPNELKIMRILLEYGCLIFGEDEEPGRFIRAGSGIRTTTLIRC